jgi:hypothetical protein
MHVFMYVRVLSEEICVHMCIFACMKAQTRDVIVCIHDTSHDISLTSCNLWLSKHFCISLLGAIHAYMCSCHVFASLRRAIMILCSNNHKKHFTFMLPYCPIWHVNSLQYHHQQVLLSDTMSSSAAGDCPSRCLWSPSGAASFFCLARTAKYPRSKKKSKKAEFCPVEETLGGCRWATDSGRLVNVPPWVLVCR